MTFVSEVGDKTFFAAAVSVWWVFAFYSFVGFKVEQVNGLESYKDLKDPLFFEKVSVFSFYCPICLDELLVAFIVPF